MFGIPSNLGCLDILLKEEVDKHCQVDSIHGNPVQISVNSSVTLLCLRVEETTGERDHKEEEAHQELSNLGTCDQGSKEAHGLSKVSIHDHVNKAVGSTTDKVRNEVGVHCMIHQPHSGQVVDLVQPDEFLATQNQQEGVNKLQTFAEIEYVHRERNKTLSLVRVLAG